MTVEYKTLDEVFGIMKKQYAKNIQYIKISQKDYDDMFRKIDEQTKTINELLKQREQVIALIKDGRFVEALQELENER